MKGTETTIYVHEWCTERGCSEQPSYGVNGAPSSSPAQKHAQDGMVDVSKLIEVCAGPRCMKTPSYGVPGTTDTEFWALYAKEGMVNVRSKECGQAML